MELCAGRSLLYSTVLELFSHGSCVMDPVSGLSFDLVGSCKG